MKQFDSTPKKTITLAVPCSVLLDLDGEYQDFEKVGYESFYANQVLNQHQIYKLGGLLPFIQSLTLLNVMADEYIFRLILTHTWKVCLVCAIMAPATYEI